jgi:hypothetical protein
MGIRVHLDLKEMPDNVKTGNKYPMASSGWLFRSYLDALQGTGITCGIQRTHAERGFGDLVVVVPVGGRFVCFHAESGAWNEAPFEEVQVPATAYFAMLQALANTLRGPAFVGALYNACRNKIECALQFFRRAHDPNTAHFDVSDTDDEHLD